MLNKYGQKNSKLESQGKCIHSVGKTNIDLINPPHPKSLVDTYIQEGKTLIIPSRKPREVARLFKPNEYERLQKQAYVITPEMRKVMNAEAEAKKRELEVQSKMRKDELQNAQLEQTLKEGKKLTKLESDAKKKTMYLLKRAFDLQQEQEDEVKHANRLILASKCLAIRSAQVIEKELMEKELADENRRLDDMMEEQRRISLQRDEDKRLENKEKNLKFITQMMQQIKEKEIEKLQEAERVQEEARLQNRAIIQIQRDEEAKRQEKLKQQFQMREDLARANEEILRFKQTEKEENRITDLRVQEFMKKKAEREAAAEEELRQAKLAKELEIARLRAQQEKQADLQAARDEMNAIRVQEEVEREWRKKEKAAAERRKQEEENLKMARKQQIDDIRRQQAIDFEREKQEFYRIVQVQKELQDKDLEKQKRHKEEALKHKREILVQVNEKEQERINQRKLIFEEGLALRAEQELRQRYIKQALHSKMAKLRANKVPESVVKDIERQLKLSK